YQSRPRPRSLRQAIPEQQRCCTALHDCTALHHWSWSPSAPKATANYGKNSVFGYYSTLTTILSSKLILPQAGINTSLPRIDLTSVSV
ncbi:LOW QUALITY PROTEIN: hypothetical protein PanWU01x14_317120, partial [Parasponia andersonii]